MGSNEKGTTAQGKESVSLVGWTENLIHIGSSHIALACTDRPLEVSLTDRDSPLNLDCKNSECFNRVAPNRVLISDDQHVYQ